MWGDWLVPRNEYLSESVIVYQSRERGMDILKKYCRPAGDFIQFTNCLHSEVNLSDRANGVLLTCYRSLSATLGVRGTASSRHDWFSYLEKGSYELLMERIGTTENQSRGCRETFLPKVVFPHSYTLIYTLSGSSSAVCYTTLHYATLRYTPTIIDVCLSYRYNTTLVHQSRIWSPSSHQLLVRSYRNTKVEIKV